MSSFKLKPVILLTGFLGSGKTTTLNEVLKCEDFSDTAVIINEYGAVSIDHLLVEQVSENLRVLQSGCICCTVRGDLVDTLLDLSRKVSSQEIPGFSRVIIESTGLADPTTIVQTFIADAEVSKLFFLERVVATMDAVNAVSTIERYSEASKQAYLADILLVTKVDQASESQVMRLEQVLGEMNPAALRKRVAFGKVDLSVFSSKLGSEEKSFRDVDSYIDRFPDERDDHRLGAVNSHCIISNYELNEQKLYYWLDILAAMRGDRILRIKGIVRLEGNSDFPTVVHGVQQFVYPFTQLQRWPSEDRRSRIVVIGEGLSRDELRMTFEKYVAQTVKFTRVP